MTTAVVWGIVPAGGSGSRIAKSGDDERGGMLVGSKLPKQFIRVGGVPILVKTLKTLFEADVLSGITVPVKEDYIGLARELVIEFGLTDRKIIFVLGGATRQESVFNGLNAIEGGREGGIDIVLIHDAARPMVDPEIVKKSVEEAQKHGAAVVGIPATDSSALVEDQFVESYIPREKLFSIQTPQVFRYDLIMEGHRSAILDGICDATDDAGLIMRMGKKVKIVSGSPENIKITFRGDLNKIS
jgi:2-C-methyl-D-erythritol 4-phosphate cytidylyltransferase